MSFLYDFNHVLPKFKVSQRDALRWVTRAHGQGTGRDQSELVQKYFCPADKIATRFSDIPDFLKESFEDHKIFKLEGERLGIDIGERMKFYNEAVLKAARTLYPEEKTLPDHFIHTTCSGYLSPSPLQSLMSELSTSRALTHVYQMGCYASLSSVRIANSLIHDFDRVDVFHSEMCSLHFQMEESTPEQIIVQSLFADGYIRYSLSQGRPQQPHFRVIKVLEKLVPDSLKDMTWVPGPKHFHMTLSREVPFKLAEHTLDSLPELAEQCGYNWEFLQKEAVFAIHPGGPKVIDQLQFLLELSDAQVEASRHVLKTRGNMSSATLPHIWEELLKTDLDPKQPIVSLAFGPGLTLFGALFEVGN